jgi:tetratricopeptide (TPR) repeat protein
MDAASACAGQPGGGFTFSRDVAPIVSTHCISCHRPGGAAPFALTTYAEVRHRATLIATVAARRYMPPWKAEGHAFVGQKPLTPEEIGILERWASDGAPEGDSRSVLPVPVAAEWALGTPDIILTPDESLSVPADGGDVFRTLVMRVPVESTRYVRGIEFRANARVVHHATILVDRTPRSRDLARDERRDAEGFLARTAEFPAGQILGWTPGQRDILLPDALSWAIESGTDLVVQLHLLPSGKREQVSPSVGIFFASTPPVEVPALVRLGSQAIDIAPGQRDYVVSDSFVLRADVDVLALKPHAHYRARTVDVWASTPDARRIDLLRIGDWDFRWQHLYRYVQPIALPKGTTIHTRFVYDNSADSPANPQVPPERVRWGPRSRDEMGDLWVQVLPKHRDDLAVLARDSRRHILEQDVTRLEPLVDTNDDAQILHNDLGAIYLELGRPVDAIRHYAAVARLQPESATARFNLGTALLFAGRHESAIEELRRAVMLDPRSARAHDNLGTAFSAAGFSDAALEQFNEALRLEPASASAHNNVGMILMSQGRLDVAAAMFEQALRLDDTVADAHFNLALVQRAHRADHEAVEHLRRAIQLQPQWPRALATLAWLLATSRRDDVRRPGDALVLAERAAQLTDRRDAVALDALAAAYAVVGSFGRAVSTLDEALALGPRDRDAVTARRELFLAGRVYREP